MRKIENESPLVPNESKSERKEHKSDGTMFGCLIMVVGGLASIGGLLHFIRVFINLIKSI